MYKKILLTLCLAFLFMLMPSTKSNAEVVAFTEVKPIETNYIKIEDYVENFGKATLVLDGMGKTVTEGSVTYYHKVNIAEPGFLIISHSYTAFENNYAEIVTDLYTTDEMTLPLDYNDDGTAGKRFSVKKGTYYIKSEFTKVGTDYMYVLFIPFDKLIKVTKVKESKTSYNIYCKLDDQLGTYVSGYITQRKNPDPEMQLESRYDNPITDFSNIRVTCNGKYYIAVNGGGFSFIKPIKISGLTPIKKVKPAKPAIAGSLLTGECPTGNRVVAQVKGKRYVAVVEADGEYELNTIYDNNAKNYQIKLWYTDLKGTKSKVLTFNTKKKGKLIKA